MEMRTFESDNTVSDRRFDEAANMTAERITMASAIRADETERHDEQMSGIRGEVFLNMPPIPHVPKIGFQTASTKQRGPERLGRLRR